MKNLSLHCLNNDNPTATIKTLTAAKKHIPNIIAGDISNSDELKVFCATHRIKYIKLSINDNMSKCQNSLIDASDEKWHMHLNPGEIPTNFEEIGEITEGDPAVYRIPCVQSGWLNKEVRIYHRDMGCRFTNPIFESIEFTDARFLEVYVTGGVSGTSKHTTRILEEWNNNQPMAIQPKYYTALNLLMEGKQQAFINSARNYLFLDQSQSIPNTMMRYYLACALAGASQTRKEAAKCIVACLSAFVLMAEFWCLLGDLCLADDSYQRAKSFYRNAMSLGSQRRKDDPWPMHISKYQKHPAAMIAACDESVLETRTFRAG